MIKAKCGLLHHAVGVFRSRSAINDNFICAGKDLLKPFRIQNDTHHDQYANDNSYMKVFKTCDREHGFPTQSRT